MAGRATRPIEWVIAIAGGLALAALLVWILRGDDMVPAADLPAPAPAPAPAPTAPASIAPPPAAAPPALAAPPPPASVDLSAIQLRGIVNRPAGASAMLEIAGSRQRLVRVGSLVMPGVEVTAIGADEVTLMAGGDARVLRFDAAPASAPGPAVAEAPPAAAADARIAQLAATSADWRIGLAAERRDGRIIGYRVVDSARLPLLRRAGLQAGDVVTAINGTGLTSEEKVIELPAEIAGAYTVELSFLRGGSARSASVPVNR
jgi:general secretion pathway protein C